MKRKIVLLFCLAIFFLVGSLTLAKGQTYYLDQKVTVTGVLTVMNFTDANGKLERTYVIKLGKSINVLPSESSKEYWDFKAENGIKIMQVYTLNDKIKIRNFKNKKVRISGTLTPQMTAHHHTPVMVEFTSIGLY